MLYAALSEVMSFGQRIDTSKAGVSYLESREKRLLDSYGVGVLLPIFAPVIHMARLAVLSQSGGPSIVKLPRVGKGNTSFNQLKIRSMVQGSELVIKPLHTKQPNDHRITNIGKVLRMYSIDELPQVYNVRDGDMSLVGPRPKTKPEFDDYCMLDPEFETAHTTPFPGITGLEQINGRAQLTPKAVTEFTKEYTAEACIALDLDILRKTAHAIQLRRGAY